MVKAPLGATALPGIAHDLGGGGLRELPGKAREGAVGGGVRQLAVHQLAGMATNAEAEVHRGAVLGADVVEPGLTAAAVNELVDLVVQNHRHGIFEAHACISFHQAGVVEIHLRRLQ